MASTHAFAPGELPAQYSPYGYEWLRSRLLARAYTNPRVFEGSAPGVTYISVDESNVSKAQLAFDAQPIDGALTANYTTLNVAPTLTMMVEIAGPSGKVVKVRFDGAGFVSETEFTIPGGNTYEFAFGPCPASQRVVSPQMFDFYVEDESCSPVAVKVTFK